MPNSLLISSLPSEYFSSEFLFRLAAEHCNLFSFYSSAIIFAKSKLACFLTGAYIKAGTGLFLEASWVRSSTKKALLCCGAVFWFVFAAELSWCFRFFPPEALKDIFASDEEDEFCILSLSLNFCFVLL